MVTVEKIRELITLGDRRVLSNMVIALFERQVQDEKAVNKTKHTNGVGFNKPDSKWLSVRAKYCLKNKSYIDFWMIPDTIHRLWKYSKQLTDIANSPNHKPHFPKP